MKSFKIGTKGYKSPELYAKEPYAGHKTDIFELGITLFQMYTCELPFKKANFDDGFFKDFINNNQKFWDRKE